MESRQTQFQGEGDSSDARASAVKCHGQALQRRGGPRAGGASV